MLFNVDDFLARAIPMVQIPYAKTLKRPHSAE